MRNYILIDKTPVLEPDFYKFAEWFETADRRVGISKKDNVMVSTVFLGIDHNWGEGDPILFETLVFVNEKEVDGTRYSTYHEAKAGHNEFCREYLGEEYYTPKRAIDSDKL